MKKYLTSIETLRGACASIAFYADTPTKNYRIYYNGIDSGLRYEKIGNASRCLYRFAALWRLNGVITIKYTETEKNAIPRRGSNA